jgi:hypothetical protein
LRAETTARMPIKEQQETTIIQASNTKHMKISVRLHYEKHKPKAIQYKILNEENTNVEDNTWQYNGQKERNQQNRHRQQAWTVGMVAEIQ